MPRLQTNPNPNTRMVAAAITLRPASDGLQKALCKKQELARLVRCLLIQQVVARGFYSLEKTPEVCACPVGLYKNCNYIIILWKIASTRNRIANVLRYCARRERHWERLMRERTDILITYDSFAFHLFSVPISIYHLGLGRRRSPRTRYYHASFVLLLQPD